MADGEERRRLVMVGRASLAAVAFFWGTYSPTIKFILSSDGGPTPSTLSFIKTGLSVVILIVTYVTFGQRSLPEKGSDSKGASHDSSVGSLGKILKWKSGSLFWSVVEFGLLETCGSFCQTIGISLTSAVNASFLIQSVTVFTPIISSFAGDRLGTLGWIGCITTLVGSLFVTLNLSLSGISVAGASLGEMLILISAALYAIATVRLGTLVEDFPAEQMAVGQSIISFLLATVWLGTDITRPSHSYPLGAATCPAVGLGGNGRGVVDLWPGFAQLAPWLAVLWLAIGPEALASLFRNKGQQILPPSQAQILFAATPFWSTLVATCVLQTDPMRLETWIGGSLILLGAVLSSHDSD